MKAGGDQFHIGKRGHFVLASAFLNNVSRRTDKVGIKPR
jgi:hypothetical protein